MQSVESGTAATDNNASRKQAVAIFDEAAMVRDLEYVFENSVRPLLADYKGEAWFLSTPRGINYFKTLQKNLRQLNRCKMGVMKRFIYNEGFVVAFYPLILKQVRQHLGDGERIVAALTAATIRTGIEID